ncbi:MAG: hypothetical protein RBR97_20135 [Bacteroidales bacterium]|nr:hypothetical protein [Bacteroidales bacterium]
MSRQILINVQYKNNKICSYGVFSGKNADYKSSQLCVDGLNQKIEMMKKEISGKAIKKIWIDSLTSNAIHWTDSSSINVRIDGYKNLNLINLQNLIDINNRQHIATI